MYHIFESDWKTVKLIFSPVKKLAFPDLSSLVLSWDSNGGCYTVDPFIRLRNRFITDWRKRIYRFL